MSLQLPLHLADSFLLSFSFSFSFNSHLIVSLPDTLRDRRLPVRSHYWSLNLRSNVWFTLTVKNDAVILDKASKLHDELVKTLMAHIPDGDFTSHVAMQPIPRSFAECSMAAGGNVMGLERHLHDGLLLQASVSVRTPDLATWVVPHVRAVVEGVRGFAENIDGGVLPWLHLNYAHGSQDVLQSYGAENVAKLKAVSARYDPDGVFQKLCPGGFKMSAVNWPPPMYLTPWVILVLNLATLSLGRLESVKHG
jgi:hypothetical protein